MPGKYLGGPYSQLSHPHQLTARRMRPPQHRNTMPPSGHHHHIAGTAALTWWYELYAAHVATSIVWLSCLAFQQSYYTLLHTQQHEHNTTTVGHKRPSCCPRVLLPTATEPAFVGLSYTSAVPLSPKPITWHVPQVKHSRTQPSAAQLTPSHTRTRCARSERHINPHHSLKKESTANHTCTRCSCIRVQQTCSTHAVYVCMAWNALLLHQANTLAC